MGLISRSTSYEIPSGPLREVQQELRRQMGRQEKDVALSGVPQVNKDIKWIKRGIFLLLCITASELTVDILQVLGVL
jgi:hypothetical protein